MRVLILSATALATFALTGCASTDIAGLTKHLNDRNCATEGSFTVGGLLPPTGYAKWDCGKAEDEE